MGTHIDIIFPHESTVDTNNVDEHLNRAFSSVQGALNRINEYAWYSIHFGEWQVSQISDDGNQYLYIDPEGPYGFDISIHSHTCCLGHPERFLRLYDEDSPVAIALQTVVLSVVTTISGESQFVCVAGGMGDSDHVLDSASQGGTFADVCRILTERMGSPAKTWDELANHSWALIHSGDG